MAFSLKKSIFFLCAGVIIFMLGSFGGLLLDRYVMPTLATVPFLTNIDIFTTLTERVTIINKTEQIIIREDDSVEKIVSQPATAVVNIVALATQDVSSQKERATITGVLLTNDGLVVTYSEKPFGNGDIRYSIVLFDGTSHAADFVGYDTLSNLSFFRLRDTTNTPAIALANSDDARVGKKLIAMGNAFAEYQNRLSVGILGNNNQVFNLSGKTVSSSEKWEGVFEMNVDNTEDFIGGPVIGFNGEMVGLMGAIVMDNTLQTFLIPSNVIRESLGRAVSKTLDKRPVLGIYYLPITKTLALGQGLSRDHGALIYSPSGRTGLALIAGSPAMRAGLQVGDIIIAINGSEITLDTPLPKILTRFNRGDTIEMLIVRNEAERTLSIAL